MKENRNRFTIIDNDLIDAFAKINLSPYEWRVIFAIIRHSYGWNKEEATLTYPYLESYCRIRRYHIARAVKSLLNKQIISKNDNKYKIQDFTKWNVQFKSDITNSCSTETNYSTTSGNKTLPNQVTSITYSGNKTLPNQVTSITYSGNKTLPNQVTQTAEKSNNFNEFRDAKYNNKYNIKYNLSNNIYIQDQNNIYIETSENKKERDLNKKREILKKIKIFI